MTVRMPRQPHARWVSDLRHALSPPHPLQQGLCAASAVCAIRKEAGGTTRMGFTFHSNNLPWLLERSAPCLPPRL